MKRLSRVWTMVESESRCFVRVWHDKSECRRSGRPILVVTYRLAFEAFSGVDNDSFDLVYYNEHARERVLSVGMFDGQMRLALGPETFLGRWATEVTSITADRGLKQLIGLEVWPLLHNVTAVQMSVAYALHPQHPFRRIQPEWKGRAEEWIQQASFLEDYSQGQRPVLDGLPSAPVEILVEFKPRLFRCWGLH